MNNTLCLEFLKELKAEAGATRKCLERISPDTFMYKPHEKSMAMGYLALIVAEVPKWIAVMINEGEINFATFTHIEPKTTDDLINYFDDNMRMAEEALTKITDDTLNNLFSLKSGETVLATSSLEEGVSSTINHGIHHRGQLTVYMRLNDVAVPSIYGPSADEKSF